MHKPTPSAPIEAVIFDLGRVLVRVDFTRGLFRLYPEASQTDDLALLEHLMNDEIFREFTSGNIEPNELYRLVSGKYHLDLPFEEFTREWCNIFEEMDGMEDMVKAVSNRYPVGLLSDVDILHWNYCRLRFPVIRHFSSPTLSFEIHAMKPAEICYLTAARNVGKPTENCLFIDDRPGNVEGAIRAGMRAIQFLNRDQLICDLTELRVL